MIKRVGIILTTMLLALTTTATVLGYSFFPAGSLTTKYSVKVCNCNSLWLSLIDNSIASWNSTPTPVNITKSSTAKNNINASNYTDTWYGYYIGYNEGISSLFYFDIKLNANTIQKKATNFNNFVQSVLVHELGHSFSLDDNPPGVTATIMYYDRDRNIMTTPQTDDINGVNDYYTHTGDLDY